MRRGGRRGFVLISVLGALIVLTSLVAAVAYLVRVAATGAAATRAELVMDALTRSGFQIAGYELFELKRTAAAMNGQQIRLNDGVVTLFVVSEGGKIDLNAASPETLAAAWTSIGAPGLTPVQFAARVRDFRDPDSETDAKGGAEATQYAADGSGKAPSNAPFEQVDQIQNVLGVPPAAARALAPLLTVHNPGGKISVFDAPPAVVRAMPGGVGLLDKIAALRARPPVEGESDEAAAKAGAEALGESAKLFGFERTAQAYTVRVEAARGGVRRSAAAILTRARSGDALYFVTDLID
ncbi:type II secretion system protein GspK [Methylopila sp. M107]|uniref:general secretion pathway protein GspK n=1 Tax=Methylopila sp. M107 TaxID=1101190 RepID=UPI000360F1B8|nr:type II secretion system protein GspK [Methylopila sp. M107]